MRHEKTRDDKGKVTFRIVDFEIEANNATLQDTIRSIVNSIGRGPSQQMRVLDSNSAESQAAINDGAEQSSAESTAEEDLGSSRSEPRLARKSSPRSPRVLDDLKVQDAKVPLKEYINERNPGGHNERYLAIAMWLKENFNLSEISMDHVHTCYRHLGSNTPKDASAPFRSMTNQNGWFTKATGKGPYAINHVGEGVVMNMGKGK